MRVKHEHPHTLTLASQITSDIYRSEQLVSNILHLFRETDDVVKRVGRSRSNALSISRRGIGSN